METQNILLIFACKMKIKKNIKLAALDVVVGQSPMIRNMMNYSVIPVAWCFQDHLMR